MKRSVSYSDSFLVLHKFESEGALTPILIPTTANIQDHDDPLLETLQPEKLYTNSRSKKVVCFLFLFKGSLHLLLISAFETLFYFLYVNKSENAGILKTIDTYYQPLVSNCSSAWSNETRWFVSELLQLGENQTAIDQAGLNALRQRDAHNQSLLLWSSMYSVICAVICAGSVAYVQWNQWIVPWKRMISENLMFILILAVYEVFFFRTIIYEYDTISTSELNQYIMDGLSRCSLQTSLTELF
jgi:hypothetical protein